MPNDEDFVKSNDFQDFLDALDDDKDNRAGNSKTYDPVEENNYQSYVPSAKENSGRNSHLQPTLSRRNIQRQNSQDMMKSELPNDLGFLQSDNRPPSRRNAQTPTAKKYMTINQK